MTAIHNTHKTKRQMHSNIRIFKFRVYLISYARLFTKLSLFEILLHLLQRKFPDLQYILHIKKLWWWKMLANFVSYSNSPNFHKFHSISYGSHVPVAHHQCHYMHLYLWHHMHGFLLTAIISLNSYIA